MQSKSALKYLRKKICENQKRYETGSNIKNYSLHILNRNTEPDERENHRYRNKSQNLTKYWSEVNNEPRKEEINDKRNKILKSTEFYSYMLEFYDKMVNKMNKTNDQNDSYNIQAAYLK